jgi:hypothetical protein
VNNNEKHHICAGIRQQNTLKTDEQCRMGGEGEKIQWRGIRLT